MGHSDLSPLLVYLLSIGLVSFHPISSHLSHALPPPLASPRRASSRAPKVIEPIEHVPSFADASEEVATEARNFQAASRLPPSCQPNRWCRRPCPRRSRRPAMGWRGCFLPWHSGVVVITLPPITIAEMPHPHVQRPRRITHLHRAGLVDLAPASFNQARRALREPKIRGTAAVLGKLRCKPEIRPNL